MIIGILNIFVRESWWFISRVQSNVLSDIWAVSLIAFYQTCKNLHDGPCTLMVDYPLRIHNLDIGNVHLSIWTHFCYLVPLILYFGLHFHNWDKRFICHFSSLFIDTVIDTSMALQVVLAYVDSTWSVIRKTLQLMSMMHQLKWSVVCHPVQRELLLEILEYHICFQHWYNCHNRMHKLKVIVSFASYKQPSSIQWHLCK